MRKYSVVFICLLVLLSFSNLALADDHGNGCGGSTVVVVPSVTSGSIETAGDNDWFRIDIPSSGTLKVYTTGSTNTYGYLFDWWGCHPEPLLRRPSIAWDGNSGQGNNFSITYQVDPGTHYIWVKHEDPAQTGNYLLHIEFSGLDGDDHGDWLDSATSVAINSTTSGSIETCGDYDFFIVDVTSSGTLTVYTEGNTDTYGYLRESTSSIMYEDDDSGSGTNFRFDIEDVPPGSYYIAVRHSDGCETGNYQLRVELSDVCYSELPEPELVFTGIEDYEVRGNEFTRYRFEVTNSEAFPDDMFAPAPHLPACGLNTNSSRTWVDIYDNNNNRLYGFCAFDSSDDLERLWFARPKGTTPPESVYIVMNDRKCGVTYTYSLAKIVSASITSLWRVDNARCGQSSR